MPVYRTAATASDHRFCSQTCKTSWMTGRELVERPEKLCEQCGRSMRLTPDERSRGKRFCGSECRAVSLRAKPGYRYTDSHGYVWLYPNGDGSKILEHRWVMEQALGRPLRPEETVHHRTGGLKGRSDNQLANLELWTGNHPKGHRVEDVLNYCRAILALYGDVDERARYVC